MDPLSALAIAAAVFQFLELGGKLLNNGWEKYKQMRQEMPDFQKLAEQSEELRRTLDDLSLQISGIRQINTDMKNTQHAETQTQLHLLQLLSKCTTLSNDFEKVKNTMKPPNSRKIISELHQQNHMLGGSGKLVEEKHCKECQKMKDDENAEFNKMMQDIERIKSEFEPLKRNVIDAIIFCLWDDSKQTKQWELQFSNQLGKVIGLLEKIQMNTSRLQPPLQYQEAEVVRLGNAIQPLIQPGTGFLSLNQLSEGIIQYVKTGNGSMGTIRQELLDLLWKDDWKPAESMIDNASVKIDTTMVAQAIAADIQFNDMEIREEAISKSLETTYTWIFQNEPPMKDGMPLWSSFPRWLEDNSNKVYWITGKPGSGKSTMMKLILQKETLWNDLSQSLGALRLLLIKYYAWHPGSLLQKSIQGLKRTVIFQALKQLPDMAPILSPRRWAFCQTLRSISGLPKWTNWEIEESFEALLSSCGKTIKLALFIDGLDEFSMPPAEVVDYIRYIRARCPCGLKLCAASRPWTEFEDEFNESPMLQMHLQSHGDMEIFINSKFGDNKAFSEQMQLYPKDAPELLTNMAKRANGVFIWLSIVVQHLLTLLSEGQSIYQAQKVLEALPSDISSLYSAIWVSIRQKNLPDASYMLQVIRAADGPFPWFEMWLIEESRFALGNSVGLPKDENSRDAALRSLKRKLAARTKCILEVSESQNYAVVDFIHRSARDWAVQPETWHLICSSYSEEFDPHLCILKAKGIILSTVPLLSMERLFYNTVSVSGEQIPAHYFWDTARRMFWHAGEAKCTPENELDIVKSLDSLNICYSEFLRDQDTLRKSWPEQRRLLERDFPAETLSSRRREDEIQPTFLGLAARFSVLSYINAVVLSDPTCLCQHFSKSSFGLLENAIFGYTHYRFTNTYGRDFEPQIPHNRRLATVRYLLENGFYQSEVHSDYEIRDIKKEIQKVSSLEPEYYFAVIEYLDKRSLRSRAKYMELRIKSLFSKVSSHIF
ncbi:hypothetical protein J3E69DRAFT_102562 [Trichoderma sp. SZMC 28015]